MAMAFSDLQRALICGETELGEVATLNEAAKTYAIKNAANGATVLAAGQTAATIKARVAVIHRSVLKITT
jgi:hypothetical protein